MKRDFESYKSRIRCDTEQYEEEGKLKAIEKTFPFIDTLEKARVDLKDGKAYELIYRQFCRLLFEMGIEEIDVLGKPFNHDNANAVTTRSVSDEAQKGTVIEVFQKGFRYGDRILRYAQVVVGE
jgi:molecular chaperone GrpE